MIKLFIVRHGQTQWNTEKRMQGWLDSPLTDEGIKNARLLGRSLRGTNISEVLTSTSYRTIHTASLILEEMAEKPPVSHHDDLREIALGEWEGSTIPELKEKYGKRVTDFWDRPEIYEAPKGGESFHDLRKRVARVLDGIIEKHEIKDSNANILIVSHAATVKNMLAIFKSQGISRLWDDPHISGTSLSIVELGDGGSKILIEGSMNHIG